MYYMCDECEEEDCVTLPVPDRVKDNVFISGSDVAECKEALKKHNITHILNLKGGKQQFPKDFTYLIFDNVTDSPCQDLLSLVPKCIEFIKAGNEAGGILVHCAAGVSRSATIVCAYLMQESNLTASKALKLLRTIRPCICPNQGFRQQLNLWYDMKFDICGTSKYHQRFELLKQSINYEKTKILPNITLAKDPEEEHTQSEVFACISCHRKLFDTNNIIEHEKGGLSCSVSAEHRFCDSYFIEPISWMNLSQPCELRCPNANCNVQLGTWCFGKSQCSCETVLYPAFRIIKTNICKILEGDLLQNRAEIESPCSPSLKNESELSEYIY